MHAGPPPRLSCRPLEHGIRTPALAAKLLAAAALAAAVLGSCSNSGSDADVVGARTFIPSVEPGRAATVWAVGDGADGKGNARAVARLIARDRPSRFLYLGDVYDRGTASEFARNYRPTYGRLARITAPTPGNHDWHSRKQGYVPYWRTVTGSAVPTYYSFQAGGWEIISLNSEESVEKDSDQLRWLRSRLSGSTTCRLAFWHRPRQSAGKHGDQDDVAPLWNALRGRAAIVVNGHDHDMQRFKPRDGIIQFVSGAGGHGLYEVHADRRLAFSNDRDYGALRLRLASGSARYSFVSVKGKVLDRGRIRCRR
jgi:Calcineurin-like phosphoesterase